MTALAKCLPECDPPAMEIAQHSSPVPSELLLCRVSGWPFRTQGSKENPAVLLLHGFMGSGSDWLSTTEELSKNWFCVMPDLPGCGRNTDRAADTRLGFDTIETEFSSFLEAQNLRNCNLVAYSMGARFALYSMTHGGFHPARAVIEGGSPGIVTEVDREQRVAVDTKRADAIRNDLPAFLDAWYGAGLFGAIKESAAFDEMLSRRIKENDPEWVAKVIVDLSPGAQPSVLKSLSTVSCPVLFIAGEKDEKYKAVLKDLSDSVCNGELQIVSDAGHNVHLERPDVFARMVQEFFSREC